MQIWEICMQITYWEICIQVRKQQLEPDMELQTGSKSGKEDVKAVYCRLFNLYAEDIMWNARLHESTSWNQVYWEKYQ